MSQSLEGLMAALAKKKRSRADEIFAVSVVLMAMIEDVGWNPAAFAGVLTAYFCPDEALREHWLQRIADVCDEELDKVPLLQVKVSEDDAEDATEEILPADVITLDTEQ